MVLLSSVVLAFVLLGSVYAHDPVEITSPISTSVIRYMFMVQYDVYQPTPEVGGIKREKVVCDGETTYDQTYDSPDYNFLGRMHPGGSAEHFQEGDLSITVYVTFWNDTTQSGSVTATDDVDIVYQTYRMDHISVKVWCGGGWYQNSLVYYGGNPLSPINTTGNPQHIHNPYTYCTNGNTPPCTPWTNDTTKEPVQFGMGARVDGGNGWTHHDVYGHSDAGGSVGYLLNSSGRNMGHFFLTMPGIEAPCGCQRGSMGIHGGGHSSRSTDSCLGVNQGADSTHGCIRVENGCPICATGTALQALGHYHQEMRDKGHHLWLYVSQ
jgi:hypothetical protein